MSNYEVGVYLQYNVSFKKYSRIGNKRNSVFLNMILENKSRE